MVGARPRTWYQNEPNRSWAREAAPPSSSSSSSASSLTTGSNLPSSSSAAAASAPAKRAAADGTGLFQFDTTPVEDPNAHVAFDWEFCHRAHCSHCQADIRTNYNTELSWLHPTAVIISWLLLGWFAWIPLLALWGQLKDVVHTCPRCRNVIGRRSRLGFRSLQSAVVTCRCASCAVMVNRKYVLVIFLLLGSVGFLLCQDTIPLARLPFFRALAAFAGADQVEAGREAELLDPATETVLKEGSRPDKAEEEEEEEEEEGHEVRSGGGESSSEAMNRTKGGKGEATGKLQKPSTESSIVFSNMTWEDYFAATAPQQNSKSVHLRTAARVSRASLRAAAALKGRVVRWQGRVSAIRSRLSSPDEAVSNAIIFSMQPDRSLAKLKNLGSVVVFFGIQDRYQVQDLVPGISVEFQAQLVKLADEHNPDLMRLHPAAPMKTLPATSEVAEGADAVGEAKLRGLDALLSKYAWSVHLAGTEDLVNGQGLVGMLSHNDPALQMGLVLVLLVGALLLYTLFMYVQDECMS